MTSPQRPPRPSGSPAQKGRQGVKALIATASLAATLGGWALLATERASGNKATQAANVASHLSASDDAALGFQPLPTLAPLLSIEALPTEVVQPTPLPQPTLRVAQPPPQRVVHVGGGGGNGSGGGPAPAAQTSSSR